MSIVQVLPGDRRRIRSFARLPAAMYGDHPTWAPDGLWSDAIRQHRQDRHPFYEHSEAAFFVAEDDGEVVGRISVVENRRYNEHHDSRTGFFGAVHFPDNTRVVRGLVASAASWARTRRLRELRGPRGLQGFDGSIRVEGFDQPPVLGLPYNPAYYDPRLQEAGLRPSEDFLSGHIRTDTSIPAAVHAIGDRVIARGSYRVQSFDSRRDLRAWAPRIRDAYLASVSELDSFYPPTDREADELTRTLLAIANPRGVSVVLRDESVVGFLLAYPNLAPALRRARGRLLPLGWWHLLAARRSARWYCINGLGLLPDHRGRGANAMLYSQIARTASELAWAGGHVIQVAASNLSSLSDMEKLGTTWTTRHRRYRMDL